jgi:hypothetical protein
MVFHKNFVFTLCHTNFRPTNCDLRNRLSVTWPQRLSGCADAGPRGFGRQPRLFSFTRRHCIAIYCVSNWGPFSSEGKNTSAPVFMAWCLTKHRDNLILLLLQLFNLQYLTALHSLCSYVSFRGLGPVAVTDSECFKTCAYTERSAKHTNMCSYPEWVKVFRRSSMTYRAGQEILHPIQNCSEHFTDVSLSLFVTY